MMVALIVSKLILIFMFIIGYGVLFASLGEPADATGANLILNIGARACVKIGDTPSDIAEGLNAGMWTIGVTRTGNEVGLSKSELDALSVADRAEIERKARGRLRVAGAHYIAEAVAECDPFLLEIDRRIGSGERP